MVGSGVLDLTAWNEVTKGGCKKSEVADSTTKATVFHSVSLSVSPVLVDTNITVVFPLCYRL